MKQRLGFLVVPSEYAYTVDTDVGGRSFPVMHSVQSRTPTRISQVAREVIPAWVQSLWWALR